MPARGVYYCVLLTVMMNGRGGPRLHSQNCCIATGYRVHKTSGGNATQEIKTGARGNENQELGMQDVCRHSQRETRQEIRQGRQGRSENNRIRVDPMKEDVRDGLPVAHMVSVTPTIASLRNTLGPLAAASDSGPSPGYLTPILAP